MRLTIDIEETIENVHDRMHVKNNVYAVVAMTLGLTVKAIEFDKPSDQLIFCPKCHAQHIDEPGKHEWMSGQSSHTCKHCGLYDQAHPNEICPSSPWTNPPHRTHTCQFCQHEWRPSDDLTNGVAIIKTKGQKDKSPIPSTEFDAYVSKQLYEAWEVA